MSQSTAHKIHIGDDFVPVRFDELEPFGEVTMSRPTFEHITKTRLVDASLPVRVLPGEHGHPATPALVAEPEVAPEPAPEPADSEPQS